MEIETFAFLLILYIIEESWIEKRFPLPALQKVTSGISEFQPVPQNIKNHNKAFYVILAKESIVDEDDVSTEDGYDKEYCNRETGRKFVYLHYFLQVLPTALLINRCPWKKYKKHRHVERIPQK